MIDSIHSEPLELLIVEDNIADSELLVYLFDKFKPSAIQVVNDGQAALDYLFRRDPYQNASRPHVVLLDLNIPKKDGFEVIAAVKADEHLRFIPIIILSTSRNQVEIQKGRNLGAADFISKPLDLDEFEILVDRLWNVEFPKYLRASA